MKQMITVCTTLLLTACASAPEAVIEETVENKFSAEHAQLYLQAETAHLKTNNNEEARALLEQLLASDLSDYERFATYQLLAGIKLAQSDYTGAIEALETVSELDTSSTEEDRRRLQYNIGILYLQAHTDTAEMQYAEASLAAFGNFEARGGELTPKDRWRMAYLYEKVGRVREAIPLVEDLYDKTTDKETKFKQGEFLAYLYSLTKDYKNVRDIAQELWQSSGDERAISTAIGAMYRAGWDQEAFEWCSKTSFTEGLSDDAAINLLKCQKEAGKALDYPTDIFEARLCEEFNKGCRP